MRKNEKWGEMKKCEENKRKMKKKTKNDKKLVEK